ncbi:arginine repressor [Novisyntrophococcus fermenticellae]|uniref:arginine repressor n=1 Tax=Novisyntrophococcus fermenticellae TaxID=2068655 RepID=UPI001E580365|nr:arginine repressor [Novisyntrophococcus fermenticellae]
MKIARHAQILKLINQYDIETQEELAARLNESGFRVTQATVSRDIRQLKLTKITKENGHSKYAVLQGGDPEYVERYVRVLRDAMVSMDLAENLLVVKTVSGMAMAAAAALDELNWSEIVGCIAGDDTVMCAIRSREEALVVMDKLRKTLQWG